jgi:hypothetical protein
MKKAILALSIIGFAFISNAQNSEGIKNEELICEDEPQNDLNTTYSDTAANDKQVIKKETSGRNKKRLRKSLFADCDGIDFRNVWGTMNRN